MSTQPTVMFSLILLFVVYHEVSTGLAEFLRYHTISRFRESCDGRWIGLDSVGLDRDLKTLVYGQPILRPIILPVLEMHFNENYQPKKPLVLSFHGWPGTGKNYVADIIAKNIYKMGTESKFRKAYHGSIHFPHQSEIELYKSRLRNEIQEQILLCQKSVFIFDEIDKTPDGIFDALRPYLDHNAHIENIDYRRSIFIFLSNIGSERIIEKSIELFQKGYKREQYKVKDFEKTLMTAAYNEKGGLRRCDLIDHHLIDVFVPFMPLERRHVLKCIEDSARKHKIHLTNETITDIMDHLVFGPEPVNLFSTSGCKNLDSKVNIIVAQMKYSDLLNDEL